MDINASYIAFLTGLDQIPNLTTIGPSIFSTMSNWPLPALTVDLEGIAIGSATEDKSAIGAAGLTLPMVIHVPIDMSNFRTLLSSALSILNKIIPVITTNFADYNVTIADMWCYVVPFGGGDAFGVGFTLTVTSI